jgi:hypothetical protein
MIVVCRRLGSGSGSGSGAAASRRRTLSTLASALRNKREGKENQPLSEEGWLEIYFGI